jgi:hypothetical protein
MEQEKKYDESALDLRIVIELNGKLDKLLVEVTDSSIKESPLPRGWGLLVW